MTYEMLYTFREFVIEWSFSISMYNKYVYLLQKVGTASFLLISNEEHILSIEIHHETFIVITIDNNRND